MHPPLSRKPLKLDATISRVWQRKTDCWLTRPDYNLTKPNSPLEESTQDCRRRLPSPKFPPNLAFQSASGDASCNFFNGPLSCPAISAVPRQHLLLRG